MWLSAEEACLERGWAAHAAVWLPAQGLAARQRTSEEPCRNEHSCDLADHAEAPKDRGQHKSRQLGPPHLRLQGRSWMAVRNIVPVPLHLQASATYFVLKTLGAVR